jgi:hypothetical protein
MSERCLVLHLVSVLEYVRRFIIQQEIFPDGFNSFPKVVVLFPVEIAKRQVDEAI